MRIAIMMRAMDQDTGFRAYVERLVDAMTRIASDHHFVLLYRKEKWYGQFADRANVTEVVARPQHKLLWDQVGVPLQLWRHGADVVFNPKFSVPFVSPCPVTMGLAEPAWWARPDHHPWWDVMYMRMALPLYVRRCAHIFPMSQFILDENRRYLGLPFGRATIAYGAPNLHFRRMENSAELQATRERYGLPSQFVLAVTRVENIGNERTTFTDTKNVQTALRAWARIRDRVPHELVIAGRRVREFLGRVGWNESDFSRVRFLDFVPHEEIPALYNLAQLFVLPSYYEGFAFTLTEAMVCGCPIVASTAGACPETTGGAALLADPDDPEDFAAKMLKVLENDELRSELRYRGLSRATFFSWDRTARTVLDALEDVAGAGRPARDSAVARRGERATAAAEGLPVARWHADGGAPQ